MHVLVINTGKPEAVGALKDAFPVEVSVLTERKYVASYGESLPVSVVDSINDFDEVAEAVLDIHRQKPFDRVVAPTERTVRTGAFVRELLHLPGLELKTATNFTNKLSMKAALRSAHIPTADFLDPCGGEGVDEFIQDSPHGCIVKPAFGSGSIGTSIVRSASDLPDWVTNRPTILERRVQMNAEIHAEGVVKEGRLADVKTFRYFAPVLGTEGKLSGSYEIFDAALVGSARDLHQQVVTALGMREGITHLQLFETEDELLVNEIACRPPGGGIVEQVANAGGTDVWRAFFTAELALPMDGAFAASRTPRSAVRIKLPLPTERVAEVSGVEDLNALLGVSVHLGYSVGDEAPALIHSGATGGYVFASVESETDARALLERVGTTFRFGYVGELTQ